MKADLLQNNHFTYGATRGIPASGCNGRRRRHFKRKNDMKPMKTLPLLLLALAVGAQAQDDSDTGWHSSVGMSAGLAPRYLGSDDYHATISPEFSFTDGTSSPIPRADWARNTRTTPDLPHRAPSITTPAAPRKTASIAPARKNSKVWAESKVARLPTSASARKSPRG